MLVYVDLLSSGLVPARLLALEPEAQHGGLPLHPRMVARVRLTASRGPYKRGEVQRWLLSDVIPRSHVQGLRGRTHARVLPYDLPRMARAAGIPVEEAAAHATA